ncbi:MAG: signal peptidase I [bacterium]
MQENETDELNEKEPEKEDKKLTIGSVLLSFFDFLKTIIIIVILAALIRQFLIQPFIVDGQSMEPNFQNNDYLITDKISYRLHAPQRGEAIIFHPPDNPSVNYLKRITGVPGDTIEVKNGEVFVNSKKIVEPYVSSGEKTKTPSNDEIKVTLKSDEYFVLGDNRDHSRDSREIGPIPKENIVSRIWLRLFPLNAIGAPAAQHYQTIN